jgi:hypothetical protein
MTRRGGQSVGERVRRDFCGGSCKRPSGADRRGHFPSRGPGLGVRPSRRV